MSAPDKQEESMTVLHSFIPWRDITEGRITRVESQLGDLRVMVTKVEKDLEHNSRLTTEIKRDTSAVVSAVNGLVTLGKVAVWVGAIATLVVTFNFLTRYFGAT